MSDYLFLIQIFYQVFLIAFTQVFVLYFRVSIMMDGWMDNDVNTFLFSICESVFKNEK